MWYSYLVILQLRQGREAISLVSRVFVRFHHEEAPCAHYKCYIQREMQDFHCITNSFRLHD